MFDTLSRTFVIFALAALLGSGGALAAEKATPLGWEDLIPPEAATGKARAARGIVTDQTVTPEMFEAAPAGVVQELDGKLVRMPGFLVPLTYSGKKVTEFLLVPYFGACIHVPPPPPNQIVLIHSAKGVTIKDYFDAVVVTGKLKVASVATELADVGYRMEADKVEAYDPTK